MSDTRDRRVVTATSTDRRAAGRLARVTLSAVVAAALAGCDGGDGSAYPARGRVLDAAGAPLAGATVILHPVGAADSAAAKPAGLTGPDGAFVLTTYSHQDGAPAGDYVVTVEWRAAPKTPADDPPDRLKGKFRDPKKSPFRLSVARGDNELAAIKLP